MILEKVSMGKLRDKITIGIEATQALQVILDKIEREVIRRTLDSVYKRDCDTVIEADILEAAHECGLRDWMDKDD
jgi:hypothetical protein